MKTNYQTKNHRIPKNKIRVYAERLKQVKENNGGLLRPTDVVSDARSTKAPYHSYFEWDNTVAGEKFRVQQARELIQNVVEVVIIDRKPTIQRSFYSVVDRASKENVFVTLKEVVNNEDYTSQLLGRLKSQLEGATETVSSILHLTKNNNRGRKK